MDPLREVCLILGFEEVTRNAIGFPQTGFPFPRAKEPGELDIDARLKRPSLTARPATGSKAELLRQQSSEAPRAAAAGAEGGGRLRPISGSEGVSGGPCRV